MVIVQGILILFILLIILRVVMQFKNKKMSVMALVIWLLFWAGALLITGIPDITSHIADKVGVGRGVDLVVYISIITLFYVVFKLFTKVHQLERNITDIVSAIAQKNNK